MQRVEGLKLELHCSVKRFRHARAYLNFQQPQQVLPFKQQFDSKIFAGEKNAQYRCQVEYAPYQRVPKTKVRHDPKEGTIEQGERQY